MTPTQRATLLAVAEARVPRTVEIAQVLGVSLYTAWHRLAPLVPKGWLEVCGYWAFTEKGKAAARGVGIDVS